MARAIELQRDAIERLSTFEKVLVEHKRDAQTRAAEGEANQLLALTTMLNVLRSELAMFVALMEDRAGAAWDHLVVAQNDVGAAVRAHPGASGFEPYSERLLLHERNLFPPQLFLSPGMTVGYSECSICSSPYGECVHVAGRAYMGEFCARVITEVSRLEEVSLVEHPKDKRRRIIAITDEDGVKRDFLTWRPEDEETS